MKGSVAGRWSPLLRIALALSILILCSAGCKEVNECFQRGENCADADGFSAFGRAGVPCCDATATCVEIDFDPTTIGAERICQ